MVYLQCVSTRTFLSSEFLFCTAFFSTPYLVQIQVTFRRKKKMQGKNAKKTQKQVVFPYPSRLNCWIFFFCILRKKDIVFVV